jgi:hypothetical protein
LAKEIDSVENRELRVSRATVAPGGHIGFHSPPGRPDDRLRPRRDSHQSPGQRDDGGVSVRSGIC